MATKKSKLEKAAVAYSKLSTAKQKELLKKMDASLSRKTP